MRRTLVDLVSWLFSDTACSGQPCNALPIKYYMEWYLLTLLLGGQRSAVAGEKTLGWGPVWGHTTRCDSDRKQQPGMAVHHTLAWRRDVHWVQQQGSQMTPAVRRAMPVLGAERHQV